MASIDLRRNDEIFPPKVKEIFSFLIFKCNCKIVEEDEESLIYRNQYCSIRITLDYFLVGIDIGLRLDNDLKIECSLYDLIEFLDPSNIGDYWRLLDLLPPWKDDRDLAKMT
jgi:hypothetical protein